MITHIYVHTNDSSVKDFRGGPELKTEIKKALSTANRLFASCSEGERATIKKVIRYLEQAESSAD